MKYTVWPDFAIILISFIDCGLQIPYLSANEVSLLAGYEGQDISIDDETPTWLVEWARRGETGRQFVQGIDTPVQNYLVDVNLKAEGTEIEPNDLMDTFLLWSHYQLSAEYSPKNAKRVLDALRQLSEKQVYSGRQWNMIINLYETLNYSEEDKQEAIKFYLQLKPNGKNKIRIEE